MDRAVLYESTLLMALASVGLFEGARLTTIELVVDEPLGPGWYLVVLSGLLFAGGVINLARNRRSGTGTVSGPFSLRIGPASRALLLLVLYAAAMPVVGYLVSTALFFVLALRIFGVRSWLLGAAIGVALAIVFKYGFGELGGMVLP